MARIVVRLSVLVVVPGIVLGLSKLHASVIAERGYDFTSSARLVWALGFIVLLWCAVYAVGIPSLVGSTREAASSAVTAVFIAAVLISLVQLVVGDALLPRFVVFGSAIALIPSLAALGLADAASRHKAAQRDRVLFVGGIDEAEQLRVDLADGLTERPALLTDVVTVADVVSSNGVALEEHVALAGANLLVLDVQAQGEPEVVAQAGAVHEQGTRVRTLSLFYEEWIGKLPVSELERVSLLFDVGEIHRARYARAKRLMDVIVGAVGVMVVLVLTLVVLVGNLIGNRGPLLFRQERVGKGGAVFTILKFRTMRSSSDSRTWTAEDDPRVTAFGRFLRRTHLDELPQMVNILKGDLSLMGPRPEQPQYVDELSANLPFYRFRHLVRPGLTGWAQVNYGYGADEQDAMQKLQYDFYYLRRQCMRLDFLILARTARSLIIRPGR